jgi:hypothetical protein
LRQLTIAGQARRLARGRFGPSNNDHENIAAE